MTQTTDPQTTPTGGGSSSRGDARHRAATDVAVSSAKTPVSSTGLTVLGLLWALVLVAVGVVGVHDALVTGGLLSGPAWLTSALDVVGGLRPGTGLLVLASFVGLVGLLLLLLALRPRRRRGVVVGAEAGTFMRHRHLSRLVASRVATLDGVVSAGASARRRRVRVRLQTLEGVDQDALDARARSMVEEDLAVLAKPVRARVQVSEKSR